MHINKQIIDIILKYILTPIIYKVEYEDYIEILCFCDRNILMQNIYKAEELLNVLLDKEVNILDIRELPEAERLDIIKNGEIIFSEDETIKHLFEISMYEDFKLFMDSRNSVLDRIQAFGTGYIS